MVLPGAVRRPMNYNPGESKGDARGRLSLPAATEKQPKKTPVGGRK